METNGKDGPASTPAILNVQAMRTVSPLLRPQQARLAVAPQPASTQHAFVSPYPAFDAAEIRKRIQQNILLRATEQSRSSALPGARNPNAEFHTQGTTDKFPFEKTNLDAFCNWKGSVNTLKEPFYVETAIKTTAPKSSDPCWFPVFNKEQSVCSQTPWVVHPQADMHLNSQMVYDSRGRVTLDKFRVNGDQIPATVKHDCPSQNIPHTQHFFKSNASVPRVHEENPIYSEQLQRGISHSDPFRQHPSDLKQHAMLYMHNKVAGGNMEATDLNSSTVMLDSQGNIDIVSEGVIEATNMELNSMPSNPKITESEGNIKPPNLYLRAMPDNRENTQPDGNTNSASLYQENTESERKIEGENQNIQIPSNSCRQLMEANTPIIETPVKFNNYLPVPVIPKAEYIPDYSTPKPPGEYGARPVHSSSLYSGNLSLVPKTEYENSRSVAIVQNHIERGSTSTLMVPNMNDQVVPTADELRSALAKSLKRFKDLTVLYPGSSTLEPHGSLSMFVNTETEIGSRKRKRPRPTRPRPVIQNPYPSVNGNDRELVMRALVTYDALRRQLQDETRRPDLQAGVLMLDKGLAVNRDRRIVGAIPGVNVGDHFYFRMELCVIGLHCPTQAGIDYITAKNNEWNEPVATSIIASGGYEDDEDVSGEELIYTGHGGNNYLLDRKQPVDQKLERGNFALERSRHYQIEIRVIRGIKDSGSPSGKIYIYDGLYKVQNSWLDRGRSGSGVFKYKLIRTPGQPELGSVILKNARRWKLDPTLRVGLVHPDVSLRIENLPVCLVNDVDNEKGPPHFEYITSVRYPDFLVSISQGCECLGQCSTMHNCSCIQKNGGQMPYNANGVLIKGKPLVYECGNHCKCPLSCWNRTTQRGLNARLEIFRTRGASANANGWGVRSWDPIPAGSFICEYTGEVIYTEGIDADQQCNVDSEYIFNPRKVTECGDVSHILCEQQQDASSILVCAPTPANLNFLIDASKMGNVSRFINHGSFPNANVFVQFVLHDHLDCRFPHVMLFALYNIPPLTELLLDYKEEKVLIQPQEDVLIKAKEEADIGSAFECSHKVVKIEPSYT
ncbi:histone-lysine N-methyltransferase family member SUVH9 [Cryptomeria japonica]|uniref:histone-lysine N-methyltransferase family member SUVH9 n=1 Tax=Cryptomeria japonica TaxID=3369 RepID=UPI0025AD3AA7|nr:histone-lysine N-methyltransferase family member SUVH9 [Cryptomeria japonica]XP_057827454.1 histone-lysine N-methyltransferase family member SUVH9 [Cryptomeria japonica]XP_057827455.1 histone-lysine N-methyltransferase family member SUVH9 [Cryptomeria japonica]XP_057827456.1 histone-lysine N-methyltransferase family member SUVH9 [Cryptomeria japonica]XP_057827457.1 histone-lysine N-methyltransferase family member SUVH9 [Cryptomeria japonica]XP_057827458.1 histone-lysine N-methyltransferase 